MEKNKDDVAEKVMISIISWIDQADKVISKELKTRFRMKAEEIQKEIVRIKDYIVSILTDRYLQIEQASKDFNLVKDVRMSLLLSRFVNFSSMVFNIPAYQSFGDTLGYYNGKWEFNYGQPKRGAEYTNELISEFIALGGVNNISILNWKASDDTVLYMATFKVLSDTFKPDVRYDKMNINVFGEKFREEYLKAKPLIKDRGYGIQTFDSLDIQENIKWNELPYNSRAIGAGAAMRSGCIGFFFPTKRNRKYLIQLAVESSRITHNSAIAILGSIVAALFTAYAIEKKPINRWPHDLLDLLKSNEIDEYMETSRPKEYHLYKRDKVIYIGHWQKYVEIRFAGLHKIELNHMKNPVLRYQYLSDNFSKGCDIPGSCGDDCLIMAYDALLESDGVLEKAIVYSILHPGDSDTVGSISLSWFGALYGSPHNNNILRENLNNLEFYKEIYVLCADTIPQMVQVLYYDVYLSIADDYMTNFL